MKFITHMEDAMEKISNKSLSYEAINVILPDIFGNKLCLRGGTYFSMYECFMFSTS